MAEPAIGCVGDVNQRREDEMLDAELLGYVCGILALADFGALADVFPVVGYQENGVGSLEGGAEGLDGV
jgi:hypothetical protein